MKVTLLSLSVVLASVVVATPFDMMGTTLGLPISFGKRDLGIQNKCLEIVKVDSENEASMVYTQALEILKHKLVIQFMKIEANGSEALPRSEAKADSIVNEVAASVNKSVTTHAMNTAQDIIQGSCSDKHDGWYYKQHLYHCTEQWNSTDSGNFTSSSNSTIDKPSYQSTSSSSLNGTFFKSVNKTLHYTLGGGVSHRLNNTDINYNETHTTNDGHYRYNSTLIDIQSLTTDISLQIGDKLAQYNSTRVVLNVLIDKCQILKSNETEAANGTATEITSATTTTVPVTTITASVVSPTVTASVTASS